MTNAGAFEYWRIGKTTIWRRVKQLIGLRDTRTRLIRSEEPWLSPLLPCTIPHPQDTLDPLPYYTIDPLGHPWDVLEPLPYYTMDPLGPPQITYELDIERGIVENMWGAQTIADLMLI
ncbi:hypothetical protein V496_01046 [Pseudogymnoascus sp. VKM F-4515 (FW-2607)]|nr:hypothetical protein V496_01046 [Pseudogymnoascus sp. VKM F-4515 (FW-2607)]